MKCPKCGGGRLKKYKPSPLDWDVRHGNVPCPEHLTYCFNCMVGWTDEQMENGLLDGVKPRARSEAAKVVFGHAPSEGVPIKPRGKSDAAQVIEHGE